MSPNDIRLQLNGLLTGEIDHRPTYRKAAVEDGWLRCLAWLRKHGVAL